MHARPAHPQQPAPARRARRVIATLAAAATLVALTACGSTDRDAPDATASPARAADTVEVHDTWVKAADSGMSGAFGVLENAGDADVTIASVTSPASAGVEMHETVVDASGGMVMRAKDGGFVVPAHGSLTLEPGGDHLMLMDLTGPVRAGDEVTFTLAFDDGSALDVTAPAKEYAGANESYDGGTDTATSDLGTGDQ